MRILKNIILFFFIFCGFRYCNSQSIDSLKNYSITNCSKMIYDYSNDPIKSNFKLNFQQTYLFGNYCRGFSFGQNCKITDKYYLGYNIEYNQPKKLNNINNENLKRPYLYYSVIQVSNDYYIFSKKRNQFNIGLNLGYGIMNLKDNAIKVPNNQTSEKNDSLSKTISYSYLISISPGINYSLNLLKWNNKKCCLNFNLGLHYRQLFGKNNFSSKSYNGLCLNSGFIISNK